MKKIILLFALAILTSSCSKTSEELGKKPKFGKASAGSLFGRSNNKKSLTKAKTGFQTRLIRRVSDNEKADDPPPDLFQKIKYDSQVGKLASYLTVAPQDGKKHPAIIWVFGGFGNGIGDTAWKPASSENDQSASAFRKAGIVMMYPSFRGGNDNPGFQEGLLGEVDDLIAAADFLAKQDFVDPDRIYLGGHSTGGTMVLLAAASTDRFRSIFSFGPVADVSGYGSSDLNFDTSNKKEIELRSPIHWMNSIRTPVFVFEGTKEPSNFSSLIELRNSTRNKLLHFHPVPRTNHFSVLSPMTNLIAKKIIADISDESRISFSVQELNDRLSR